MPGISIWAGPQNRCRQGDIRHLTTKLCALWQDFGCGLSGVRKNRKGMVKSMNTEKEILMTADQLEMLLEYLPDGIMLEVTWEGTDGRET